MSKQRKVYPSTLRWFLSYYPPHIKLFGLDMVCALTIALVDLAFPILTRHALNDLLPNSMFQAFFWIIVGIVGLYALRAGMMYIVTYFGHIMGVYIEADMRADLFRHLQTLPNSFFDKTRTGQLMSRVANDLFDVTELSHHGPEDVFISAVTLVGALIVLFRIQWVLALVLVGMIPFMVFFVLRQRVRMRNASQRVRERTAGINTELESSISGVRVGKAFTNEDYEHEKFSMGNDRFKQAKQEFYSAMAIFHSGLDFMLALMLVAVIGVGGVLIMRGQMSWVDLITFNLFVGAFQSPIRRLSNFIEQYVTGMAGFRRFTELMSVEPEIVDEPDARPLTDVHGEIEFRDVHFAYEDEHPVLRDINLTLRAGNTLALVGPSGGGKTTLCQLIPRFYEATQGEIRIDGKPIKSLTLRSLREHIGIVQQDVFLFAGTVKDNIRYGKVDATDEEIVRAAMQAEIHEEIMAMADGYDTVVGERGITLSGGQKQRVSIARIFLKNPPILILDEATSALDTQTEARIQASFDKLAQGRTTLVIAHRLSTIRNADEIAVIDEDHIVEYGTHEELMKLDGRYATLYRIQFNQQENPLFGV